MSSFSSNLVHSLSLSTLQDHYQSNNAEPRTNQSAQAERLYNTLLSLNSPVQNDTLNNAILELDEYEKSFSVLSSPANPEDEEERALKHLVISRIVVGIYAQALDLCLKEASEADSEAEWWSSIGRSYQSVAWYLIATLPIRLKRSFDIVSTRLREQGLPLRPTSFTPHSLRLLFPSSLRPTQLTTAFFPHTAHQSHLLFTSPLELARQECKLRQEQLAKLRDERAEELGQLLLMKAEISAGVKGQGPLNDAALNIRRALTGDNAQIRSNQLVTTLQNLASIDIGQHTSSHNIRFASLSRPSRLTLLWPRLALIPPVSILLFRAIYGSRQSIAETALEIHDTLKGFWFGYVIEPVKSILDTVRTGGDESARIVNQEAVKADLESLERMAVALSRDRLSLNDTQLQEISAQIRLGNLTPVLEVYEEDIKTPIKSAVKGTLIRSLLVQIQKAKVDLDQALSGIDKLLKSQELTFAFVGVAPSVTIVYAFVSYLRGVWSGGRGNKKLGGRRRREITWLAIRRIERVLTINPGGPSASSSKNFNPEDVTAALPALTTGLLLISVAHLRNYAESYLPVRSLLREGFLDDVADLENPDLSRTEKQRVVERMWRSWGSVLGWNEMGKVRSS